MSEHIGLHVNFFLHCFMDLVDVVNAKSKDFEFICNYSKQHNTHTSKRKSNSITGRGTQRCGWMDIEIDSKVVVDALTDTECSRGMLFLIT